MPAPGDARGARSPRVSLLGRVRQLSAGPAALQKAANREYSAAPMLPALPCLSAAEGSSSAFKQFLLYVEQAKMMC